MYGRVPEYQATAMYDTIYYSMWLDHWLLVPASARVYVTIHWEYNLSRYRYYRIPLDWMMHTKLDGRTGRVTTCRSS